MRSVIIALIAAGIFMVLPVSTSATFVPRQELTAADGIQNAGCGKNVAILGDTAVVGCWQDTANGQADHGSAYVFVRSGTTWVLQAKLFAADGGSGDQFGRTVAIFGDTIVVGAPQAKIGTNLNQGAAYVFARSGSTWTPQAKLIAADGAQEDTFGFCVSIYDDTIVAGAIWDDIGQNDKQGSAYVFVRSGGAWVQQQKLIATNGVEHGTFGFSVSLVGDTVLIGAPSSTFFEANSAYVFVRSGSTWTQQAKLDANDGGPGTQFGMSVDLATTLSGPIAVIGADATDIAGETDRGAVYIYNRQQIGGWSQTAKLTANDGTTGDHFGRGVAISGLGTTILIGAFNDDIGQNTDQGSAYVFRRANSVWTQQQQLLASDGGRIDNFGYKVALSGDTLLVGAPEHKVGSTLAQGAAYIFQVGGAGAADFDGDSRTDLGIFRPQNGQWWINRSSDGATFAATFGAGTDRITPGDLTGDGKTDIALFRPSTGQWFVLRSEDSSFYAFPFGTNGDVPAPADYDADGKTDAAVFRPSNSTWYISNSGGGTTIQTFGQAGDVPVAADYDGDGKADIAIYRSSLGQWWIQRSALGSVAYQFGASTDKTVAADYTGDGKADVGFWRPSTGEWFILRSEDNSYYSFPFGAPSDLPALGDYDGDGKSDAGVFRPSNSTWFVNKSGGGTLIQQFGQAGHLPVPNAFVR